MGEPLVINIEDSTLNNKNYRDVIYTSPHMQLTLMNIPRHQEIGWEVHNGDQFIRVEGGRGILSIAERRGDRLYFKDDYHISDGVAFIIPANTYHNVISSENLKLYSIYSPPQHQPNTLQPTKND